MLTHVDEKNQPCMVDVSLKGTHLRRALAQSRVQFPPQMREHIQDGEIYLKKGPVFQTARIAGTMAVKQTSMTIPLCHAIPIEACQFVFQLDDNLSCTITCEVKTTAKTGVEVEALHGAMIAALTVYDMCKALSHSIIIGETKLLSKTGGKSVFLDRPLYGLVLTGGKSTRMQRDKALINYKGKPHAQYIFDILSNFCQEVYLSARENQWNETPLEDLPTITDTVDASGPLSGILSAYAKHKDAYWLVVACDLLHFNEEAVLNLVTNFNRDAVATCYANREQGFPEALCALYSPKSYTVFLEAIRRGVSCPVKILRQSDCHMIAQTGSVNLVNINSLNDLQPEG